MSRSYEFDKSVNKNELQDGAAALTLRRRCAADKLVAASVDRVS